MNTFNSEKDFEQYLEELIAKYITKEHPDIYVLNAKKTVDLVICKDGKKPELFFIEVKYYNKSKNHSMVSFGGKKGTGFQPAVLKAQPDYFKQNLRWVMGSASHEGIYFLSMHCVSKHFSGAVVGEKQNGFKRSIFDKESSLTEEEFINDLKTWIKVNKSEQKDV